MMLLHPLHLKNLPIIGLPFQKTSEFILLAFVGCVRNSTEKLSAIRFQVIGVWIPIR